MSGLRFFGGASLVSDGVSLTGPATQRHRLALLALLCASHPRPLTRDKLIGYLWPERDAEHARNLLKQSIHVARKALGDGAIVSAGEEVRLGSPPPECDVIAFEAAVAQGDRHRAVALYTRPFLDGFFLRDAPEFERRVDQERSRFARAYRKALAELADERAALGDHETAVECCRRLVAEDPHDARLTVRLMEALEAAGDRAGAIRQARLHALLLEQDFEAEPEPAVMALAERIRTQVDHAGAHEAASLERRQVGETLTPLASDPNGASAPNATGSPHVGRQGATPARHSWKQMAGIAATLLVVGLITWVSARAFGREPEITRVAVLPLANLTGDSKQDYFVGGRHDALISELAQIEALTVYSRQSVLRYEGSHLPVPQIARELGVDAVIEGAVFKDGDSVRISVQLVRARPERHVMAATYHGPLNRALSLQSEVARAVAHAMQAQVRPEVRARVARVRSINPQAQEAYLTGLYHLGRASYGQGLPESERLGEVRAAIAYLEHAVTLDSAWATAHARLALAYH